MSDNQIPQDPEDTADEILQGKETTDRSEVEETSEKPGAGENTGQSETEQNTNKSEAEDEQQDVCTMNPDVKLSPASSVFGNEPQETDQEFTTGQEFDILLDSIEGLEIFNIPLPVDNIAGNYDRVPFSSNELDLLIASVMEFDRLAVADTRNMLDPNQPSCSNGPPQCISTSIRHRRQHRPYSGHAMNQGNASSPAVVGRPIIDTLTDALEELGIEIPDQVNNPPENTISQHTVAANRQPLSSLQNATATHHGTPSDDGDEDDDYEVFP